MCTAVNDQRTPTIVTDGAGGAIVCWYDLRNNRADVYAQHVNPAGVPQWTADGLAVCTVGDPQYSRWIDVRRGPACIADGAGGVIVTWVDQRNGGTGTDVYAQRVSHSGVSLWATNGSALCSAPGDQFYPEIVGDPTGGAIATWFDSRSGVGYDIYAQRIQASGALGSDETVPAASALVRSHREHGLLQVTWYTTGNAGTAATVFRRPNTSEWSSIGEIQADGAGYMTFVDRDIEDDAGYSYRLGIVGPDGVQMLLGEAWIAPLPSSFAMAPAVSTPFRNGRISMAVSTPVSFPATVQLFDVAGRKLEQSIVESAARSRQVDFGAGRRLEPGIYHVRAHCGGDALTMRVVVIP